VDNLIENGCEDEQCLLRIYKPSTDQEYYCISTAKVGGSLLNDQKEQA
jgi:hypothetical protein